MMASTNRGKCVCVCVVLRWCLSHVCGWLFNLLQREFPKLPRGRLQVAAQIKKVSMMVTMDHHHHVGLDGRWGRATTSSKFTASRGGLAGGDGENPATDGLGVPPAVGAPAATALGVPAATNTLLPLIGGVPAGRFSAGARGSQPSA
eukprot:GGOE01037656.1.p1 GENE.GGOE01037656.1~~GGOE01037656.1.p1  ORF type:complete len:147 (-),score=1.43 GGOE01037656.1:173-613(-)